jgi:hypothetical protein
MSKQNWIPCKERYPEMQLESEWSNAKRYVSDLLLVQTCKNGMFIAECVKIKNVFSQHEYYEWFSYGTGGRKMKVKSKVIAWMPLPEEYSE